jgi:hypothetical protein
MRGKWLDGHTLVAEARRWDGRRAKWTLSFDGEKVRLHGTGGDAREVSVTGELGEVRCRSKADLTRGAGDVGSYLDSGHALRKSGVMEEISH